MGRHDKFLAQLLGGRADANVGFEALCALLRRLAFQERTRGSHHVLRRAGVEELFNLQRDGDNAESLPGPAGPRRAGALRSNHDRGGRGMNAYKYELIVYWSAEDTVFVADVPELPGCMAHGATPAEAVAQAQEAIALWIDTAREDDRAVPEPKGRRLMLA